MGFILCQIAHILGSLLQAYDTLTLYLIPGLSKSCYQFNTEHGIVSRIVKKQRAVKFSRLQGYTF